MIAQAIGCVVFPPYSESFGRKQLFIAATISYCVSSIAIARASTVSVITIFRFISGLASAVPTNIVAGSAEDLFHAGHRIWMIYAWAVTTNVGACVGPIFGTFVAESLGWRWIFYLSTIITGLWSVLLLFIKESRPSQLLSKAVAEVCKESGDNTLRTMRLVCTEPIVFICSILTAVVYGLLYLFTGALPIVYKSYGFTPGQASLSFVPLILGIFSGIFTRFYDHRIYKRRQQKSQELEPEDKLTGFAIGAPGVPWIVSMLPLLLVGYATNEFGCTLTGYIADSYTVFASSAFASTAFLRAICCAGFPLFAGRMFTALTANEASSILAAVASVFCVAPVVLLKYGKNIRERSPFAKYSLEQYRHNEVDRDAVLDDDSSV
ncbi:MFS multidrug transporter protein [Rutstroemia sp. NJR-2017a BBW]|nr:MFS multidrug transporter protein [Rutstroemia sp. NJR-2017a BBW]